LLFAVGIVAALTGQISVPLVLLLLIIAAVGGDALNYYLGYWAGPKVFTSEKSWLFNKKHLLRAQAFYEKYGNKAIFLARFVPIVRTFAPFVAGIGKMQYRRFALYNVIGGFVWICLLTVSGYLLVPVARYLFGGTEVVENNLHLFTVAIILVSIAPIVIEFVAERRKKAVAAAAAGVPATVTAPTPPK
jgi:membrane-associated protein